MTYRYELKRLRTALKKAKAGKLVSIAYNIANEIRTLQIAQGRDDTKPKKLPKIKVKKKKKINKKKPDYVKICCEAFGVESKYDLKSILSGDPADCVHHIRGRVGKLLIDPNNLMPMTREEHDHHHKYERTHEKKIEHTILLAKALLHVKNLQCKESTT